MVGIKYLSPPLPSIGGSSRAGSSTRQSGVSPWFPQLPNTWWTVASQVTLCAVAIRGCPAAQYAEWRMDGTRLPASRGAENRWHPSLGKGRNRILSVDACRHRMALLPGDGDRPGPRQHEHGHPSDRRQSGTTPIVASIARMRLGCVVDIATNGNGSPEAWPFEGLRIGGRKPPRLPQHRPWPVSQLSRAELTASLPSNIWVVKWASSPIYG